MDQRKINLHTGELEFAGVEVNRQKRCVVFVWTAQTESSNHVLVKAIGFGLVWPPVRWASAFLQLDS